MSNSNDPAGPGTSYVPIPRTLDDLPLPRRRTCPDSAGWRFLRQRPDLFAAQLEELADAREALARRWQDAPAIPPPPPKDENDPGPNPDVLYMSADAGMDLIWRAIEIENHQERPLRRQAALNADLHRAGVTYLPGADPAEWDRIGREIGLPAVTLRQRAAVAARVIDDRLRREFRPVCPPAAGTPPEQMVRAIVAELVPEVVATVTATMKVQGEERNGQDHKDVYHTDPARNAELHKFMAAAADLPGVPRRLAEAIIKWGGEVPTKDLGTLANGADWHSALSRLNARKDAIFVIRGKKGARGTTQIQAKPASKKRAKRPAG